MSDSRDAINTNVLETDNQVLLIAQSVALQQVAQIGTDAIINHTIKKPLQTLVSKGGQAALVELVTVPVRGGKSAVLVTRRTLKNIGNALTKKAAGNAITKVSNGIARFPGVFTAAAAAVKAAVTKEAGEKAAKEVGEKLGKEAGEKVASRLSAKAAWSATKSFASNAIRNVSVGLTICAGGAAATGGLSCAVGYAVTAIMMAFDVVNMVLMILDPGKITALMHRDTIDGVAEATLAAMRDGAPGGTSNYFDQEVNFDVLGYFFTTDDEGNLFATDEVTAKKWNELQDEYMKKIGMPANWRDLATPIQMSVLSEPGVLNELQQEVIDRNKKLIDIPLKPVPPKIPTWLIIVLIIIALAILGIIAINFFQ